MLPLRVTVDLGAIAMKRCFAFPKAPASLERRDQIVLCHIRTLVESGLTLLQMPNYILLDV